MITEQENHLENLLANLHRPNPIKNMGGGERQNIK